MFQLLRSQTKTIVIVLISLIIPAFVLWGVSSAIVARKSSYAGKVWGQRVNVKEFNSAFTAVESRAMLTYGDSYYEIAKFFNFQDLAWERIALLREARNNNITITDKELVKHVQSIPFFQQDGIFSKERYDGILRQFFKLTPSQFEERERESLLINKRRNQINQSVLVSEQELFDVYRLLNEKVKINYISFAYNQYKPSAKQINSKQLRAFFNENQQQFLVPEQRKIAYTHILASTMPEDNVTDEAIEAFYSSNQELFKTVQKTSAKEETPSTPYRPLEDVRASIEQLLKQNIQKDIAEQKSFAISEALLDQVHLSDIEKKHGITFTETPFFQASGQATSSLIPRELIRKTFTLNLGNSSDLIPAIDGFYVLKVLEEKAPYIPSFDEAQDSIQKIYIRNQSHTQAFEAAQQTRTQIIENIQNNSSSSFNDAANKLGFKVMTPEPFTQNGAIVGIGYNVDVSKASFDLPNNGISSPLKTEQTVILLSPIKRIVLDPQELEKNAKEEKFRKSTLQQKRSKLYNAWLQDMKKQAKITPNSKYFS